MTTTYNKGQEVVGLKWQSIYEFSNELEPIIKALNDLLKKYEIPFVEDFISLPVKKNKVTPFIYPPAFRKDCPPNTFPTEQPNKNLSSE